MEIKLMKNNNKINYDIIRKTGSRVRSLMNPNTDTVASLAVVINVSPSHMSKLLYDKCEWTAEKAIRISNYFGVPFEYVYMGKDIYSETTDTNFIERFNGMLMHIDNLPSEKQKVCYSDMANKLYDVILRSIK
jgi:transcriptional regulator with XRE-family HTH domain